MSVTDSDDQLAAALEERFATLDEEELDFLKSQTGIVNQDELNRHVLEVQKEAFKVFPYSCIQNFNFVKLKISRLPAYYQLLKLGKEREGAIFLDIGCCFGNDIRKAISDGFPIHNAIASDLEADFWKLGHRLFNSSSETFPVPFVPGDIFSPTFLAPSPPFSTPPSTPAPHFPSLTTLTPLLGQVSAIHASSLFHLFDEAQQLQLARALAGLLSPLSNSVIFGSHGGRPEKGFRERPRERGGRMFSHSPESWKEMWEEEVFGRGEVRVEAELKEGRMRSGSRDEEGRAWRLVWSVTRL
ncbi:uncharacterized protein LAESUDRAFT_682254 [Laetiporus sulphureus 93-53]|uniref:Methyltransferase domain-containing protein n=1 Tax=Laetiporus sulphureus 93-53 TaxID=1314785 RepID=A0A165DFL2_9APHY|nr:uncharacterized protein LAESUDRAFT_682254 [Laetiporus sulphureus 93-53]KZT04788.1 hypothetical protein LAESUDRAFT_682254 [Laetiporus sulphureus 93-53]